MKIGRALISVSDKTNIIPFAHALHSMKVEILSTGGTAEVLRDAEIPVIEVADYTGFPECFDGRVKTLHPKVHGGFLYQRENPEHVLRALALDILPIDLVVVNLYPFEQTVAKPDTTMEQAVEKIDIGGPAMLRSAAKNFTSVTVVCDPDDYEMIIKEMKENDGCTTLNTRQNLFLRVFDETSHYDEAIREYFARKNFGTPNPL